ncbi:MAG: N-acyl-D-amino-acid deacylase family protein [Acidimicrobiia bacterium]
MPDYDLVIRGGTIADGTGAPLRPGDVAVKGGLVTAVGEVDGTGVAEIDASGALVAPGWVDIHTHYDGQAIWDPQLAPSSWHGVTTAVMGNCGVGFAPVHPGDQDRLVQLMEGVEDLPGTALHEGLAWDWGSFPEYLDALERRPHDIDVAAQVPHAAVRVHVMGERGANREPATDDDIAAMAGLTAEAVGAGALGFSTSRTLNHRTSTGDFTPTLTASAAELAGIAAALGRLGRGVIQLLSDFTDLDAEWATVAGMVKASGRPLSFTVAGVPERPDDWRRWLERISEARAAGLPITGQVAPRAIGLVLGLACTLHPFMFNPVWTSLSHLPVATQAVALRQPETRRRLLDSHHIRADRSNPLGGGLVARYEKMYFFADPPDYEPDPAGALALVAGREGRRPEEVALDWLCTDDGRGMIYMPFFNYTEADGLGPCREMLAHPHTVPGLSDGGAHAGTICDGSFPTFLLSHWGLRRDHGRFPIEWIVERQTRATAGVVGMGDRGVLAPGYRADVNVIDLDRLAIPRPEIRYDLPAGGRRLLQRAVGYRHTFVAGVETYRDGEATGATPGTLVRGPQPAPSFSTT